MSIPTLTHEEFESLLKEIGEYGAVTVEPFLITAHNGTYEEVMSEVPKTKGLRMLFLNVAVPHMYTDRNGKTLLVFPLYTTYDEIDSVFPNEYDESPWVYQIVTHVNEDLEDRIFYWRDGRDEDDGNRPLPKFNLADWRTH